MMPHHSPVSRAPLHLATASKMETVTAENEETHGKGMLHPAVLPKTLKLSAETSAQPTKHCKRAPAKAKVCPKRKKSRPSRKSGSRVSPRRLRAHKAAKVRHHESTTNASVSELGPAKRTKTFIAASPKAGKRDFRQPRNQSATHSQQDATTTMRQVGFAPTVHHPHPFNPGPLSPGLASGVPRWPSLCPRSPYFMWGNDTLAQAEGVYPHFHSKTMPTDPPPPLPVDVSQKVGARAWEQQLWPACWHGGGTEQGYLPHHGVPSPADTVRYEYSNPAGPADVKQLPFPVGVAMPRVKKPVGILRHYVSRVNDGCSTWDSSSQRAFKRDNRSSTSESTGSTVMSTEVPAFKTAKCGFFLLGIAAFLLLSIWALYPLGGVTMRAWAFNRENKRRDPVTVLAKEDRDPGLIPERSRYQHGPLLPTQNAHRGTVVLVQDEFENTPVNDTGTY